MATENETVRCYPKSVVVLSLRNSTRVLGRVCADFVPILCALVRLHQSQIIKVMLIDFFFFLFRKKNIKICRVHRKNLSSNIQMAAETAVRDILQTTE